MDGWERRSYKMFQTQFLTPSFCSWYPPYIPPPIPSHYHSGAIKASSFPFHCIICLVVVGYMHREKYSLRYTEPRTCHNSLAAPRPEESSVLITVRELITGLSVDFCCTPSVRDLQKQTCQMNERLSNVKNALFCEKLLTGIWRLRRTISI